MFIDCFTSKKEGGRLLGSAHLLGTIRYIKCDSGVTPGKDVDVSFEQIKDRMGDDTGALVHARCATLHGPSG